MFDDPDLEGFEMFDQASIAPIKAPYVTLQRGGTFSLNAPTYDALGQPDAVKLAFNESLRTIAIIKAILGEPTSKAVRRQGKNSSTWIFAGKLFMLRYNIPTTTARRYQAIVRNGKIFVDLREEGADATGVRARQKAN